MTFEQKHLVVTGGTGALGSAVVGKLLDLGAICHVPNYDPAELTGLKWEGHERVRVVAGVDLTDEHHVERFYGSLEQLWASVNIAGGFAMAPITDTTVWAFEQMHRQNARTAFLCRREAVRLIRRSGGGGRIVNVAARPALVPTGGMVAYASSKAAVAAITQSLAEEVREEGIWVNAVVPSIMNTPQNRDAMPDADHGKWPTPEDVADTIIYLASAENKTTRGGLVPVYGAS